MSKMGGYPPIFFCSVKSADLGSSLHETGYQDGAACALQICGAVVVLTHERSNLGSGLADASSLEYGGLLVPFLNHTVTVQIGAVCAHIVISALLLLTKNRLGKIVGGSALCVEGELNLYALVGCGNNLAIRIYSSSEEGGLDLILTVLILGCILNGLLGMSAQLQGVCGGCIGCGITAESGKFGEVLHWYDRGDDQYFA